jgi:hypothetical protein
MPALVNGASGSKSTSASPESGGSPSVRSPNVAVTAYASGTAVYSLHRSSCPSGGLPSVSP